MGARHGIRIELCRQPSWAAVRDKLLSGELDAAHAFYGLVYGVQLGIGGPQADMAVLMVLNRGGQAITLSNALSDAFGTGAGAGVGEALASLGRPPVLAQTFPTGTHAMWLYYWLAAHGVHPLRDVQSIVIPPPQMADALAAGTLDGFCAGEPWHAVAKARGAGRTVAYTGEIWPDHPEKVLACRRDLLGVPRELIEAHIDAPRFFDGGAVNYPRVSDGAWFVTQYRRWGMLDADDVTHAIAADVHQTALYREAARAASRCPPTTCPPRSATAASYLAGFPIRALT